MRGRWHPSETRTRFRRALAFRIQHRGQIVTSADVNLSLERLVCTAAKSPDPAGRMALDVLLSCLYPERR